MIKTPREVAIFIGFIFSLLIAFAAWGTTYMLGYDDDDSEHKTTARRDALKAAFTMFAILMLFVITLILLFPTIMSHFDN